LIFILIAIIGTVSCSKIEFEFGNEFNSIVEQSGENRILSFEFPHRWDTLAISKINEASIRFTAIDGGSSLHEYNVSLQHLNKKMTRMSVTIPGRENIKDGRYLMQLVLNGHTLKGRFSVQMKNERIMMANSTYRYTKFMGSGTTYDPYLIMSIDDFKNFLYQVTELDPLNGAGVCFSQLADFQWDEQKFTGDYISEGVRFAGTYDGMNHTISGFSRTYISTTENTSGQDVNIGLFSELLNGCTIRNLSLENVSFIGIEKNGGPLAGRVEGKITLSNIHTSGSITGSDNHLHQDCIGGLIGAAENVTLTIEGFTNNMEVHGRNYVGGAVGYVSSGSVVIKKCSNIDNGAMNKYYIHGTDNIGGVIGGIANASVVISNVNYKREDAQNIVSKGSNAGGIIGSITSTFGQSVSIDSIRVDANVSGVNNAGGLVGYMDLPNESNVDITDCKLFENRDIKATATSAGGLVGNAKGANINITSTNISSTISGGNSLGALFGETTSCNITVDNLKIYTNVITTTGENIGLMVGLMRGSTLDNLFKNLDMSTTFKVKGVNKVGGFIGYMENSSFNTTDNTFMFDSAVPSAPNKSTYSPLNLGEISGSGEYIGGAVGYVKNSKIGSLYINATVIGGARTGGIFGYFQGNATYPMKGHIFYGIVKGDGNDVGGIAGKTHGNSYDDYLVVSHCANMGVVNGAKYTGGIIGYAEKYTRSIEFCANYSKLSATGSLGGIVGGLMAAKKSNTYTTTISKCGNMTADTLVSSGNSDGGLGGIVGIAHNRESGAFTIQHCFNAAPLRASSSVFAGGILGKAIMADYYGFLIKECGNFAPIFSDSDDSRKGGIVGLADLRVSTNMVCDIVDSYNKGRVYVGEAPPPIFSVNPQSLIHYNESSCGGIYGEATHKTEAHRCLNLGKTTGNAFIAYENGLSTELYNCYALDDTGDAYYKEDFDYMSMGDISIPSNLKGFDFNNVWEMADLPNGLHIGVNDKEYKNPKLRNCPFQNDELW
jgi:hypothetical protein